jgi:hypothetical protein
MYQLQVIKEHIKLTLIAYPHIKITIFGNGQSSYNMGEGLMNGFDKKRLKDFRNWNT